MRLRESATESPRNPQHLSSPSFVSVRRRVYRQYRRSRSATSPSRKTLKPICSQRVPSSTKFICVQQLSWSACHPNPSGWRPPVHPIRFSPLVGSATHAGADRGIQAPAVIDRPASPPVAGRHAGRSEPPHRSTHPSSNPVGGKGSARPAVLSAAWTGWPCTHPDRPARSPVGARSPHPRRWPTVPSSAFPTHHSLFRKHQ